MKLSEILGWKKKESEHLNCYQFDENYCFKHVDCFDEESEGMHPLGKQGFNTALTSCDREIDREALAKELFYCFGGSLKDWETYPTKEYYLKSADKFISTMPTWLKRSEKCQEIK